ncbi:MAG: integrase arm-type DNA-binding domain-containing protein [Alphaproteobacteria bacterium]|nr:integrase arm-type DNA-binding domain-containing protein [Alphaproteobacteria bacterium]
MKLNDVTVRNLAPPERGQRSYPDDALPGLAVRVSQGGTRTFVLVHGRDRTRTTIGRYPIISLAQARVQAREILAAITLGQFKPKSLTFRSALDLFAESHLKNKNRANTAKETERLLRRALPKFGHTALSEITTAKIAALLDGMSDTPSEANHLYTALKTFMNFCFRRGYIEASPLGRLQKPHKVKARSRALSPDELRVVLAAARNFGVYGQLLRLLTYSGQRLSQVANLTDTQTSREAKTFTWSAEEMKCDEPHIVPYHEVTAELLKGLPTRGWLFRGEADPGKRYNNFSNDHRAFLKLSSVTHFTRHDLRRTYSTIHASIGTPPHITERLLAHKNGTESGGPIAKIYNRYQYRAEMRAAVEAYEEWLGELVARS